MTRPKYIVNASATINLWIETTKPYITKILGYNVLGAMTLALVSAAREPNTSSTYGNITPRCLDFCDEHSLAPLAAKPAHMAR
jgi:hypothetical protein